MSQSIDVPVPAPGSRTAIPVTAGKTLALGFDPSSADASRVRDDLVFEISGGIVVITGFFSAPDSAMPDFLLPGGEVVATVDLRDALASDFLTG